MSQAPLLSCSYCLSTFINISFLTVLLVFTQHFGIPATMWEKEPWWIVKSNKIILYDICKINKQQHININFYFSKIYMYLEACRYLIKTWKWFKFKSFNFTFLPSVEVMAKAQRQTITNATFRSMMAEWMSGGNRSSLLKYWLPTSKQTRAHAQSYCQEINVRDESVEQKCARETGSGKFNKHSFNWILFEFDWKLREFQT